IYVLKGGYRNFFSFHKTLCEPQSYVEMNDEAHMVDCRQRMLQFNRQFKRTKSMNDAALCRSVSVSGPAPSLLSRTVAGSSAAMFMANAQSPTNMVGRTAPPSYATTSLPARARRIGRTHSARPGINLRGMWEDSPRYTNRNGNSGHMHGNYGEYDSFDSQNDAHMGDAGVEHTYGGIRQLVQTSATSAREHANSMNPYATLHIINRELMELGLPSPLHLPEQAECLEDNQRVVDCLLALLQQRKRDLGFRERMDDELRKAMGEEDMLRSTIARLERELDVAQREAAMNRVKWQEAERQHGETEGLRKKLAADLRTTRSNAAMVKAQFAQDGKKREQESLKLKDRLQKLITDKHRACKVHVELANAVQRDRSGRPMDSVARDQKLHDDLLRRYNASEEQLVARVDELEDLLRRLEAALARLRDEVSPAMAADADDAMAGGAALALVASIQAAHRQACAARPPPADA
ncbi:hypothetical protein IWW57_005801, partial [Coemansia sp. S610]